MNKVEKIQAINDQYYSRLMSYASKLRKDKKNNEAKKAHETAQQLNKCLYLAAHCNNMDMILYYNNKAEAIVVEVNRFMKEV